MRIFWNYLPLFAHIGCSVESPWTDWGGGGWSDLKGESGGWGWGEQCEQFVLMLYVNMVRTKRALQLGYSSSVL